ncbi:hypothetical protein FOCG_17447 [Fusarium oxysporum f. sp. radicis-lycopersici 26381]|nr:hypothetical protein FOCG_17447 [Fusarium oxysporum f. sp. radicis-lycopersici 26381]
MASSRPAQRYLSVANALPIRDEERPICGEWLRSIGFLAPGQDQETKITRSGASHRFVQGLAAKKRKAIKVAFWERIDELDGLSKRWLVKARKIINQTAEGPNAGPFESLAAVWDLDKRRRYQSVWTSMICFLAWIIDNNPESLLAMGLELDEELEEDIVDISLAVAPNSDIFGDSEDPMEVIQGFLTKLITVESASAQNNPLLWWTSILVRSAISDDNEEDFISRGTISMNILLPDVDIRGRIKAICHYSKALIPDKAFMGWRTGRLEREVLAEEIAQDLNKVDNEWLNKEGE